MAGVSLYDYQLEAVEKVRDGSILCGGVGSGKSRTGLAYFYLQHGGRINTSNYVRMQKPADLYIITTARKRDTLEWEKELIPFMMTTGEDGLYSHKVTVDSWNNVGKYKEVQGAFFLFDEQRVIGKGQWVKSFLRIAKNNRWILLTATPGDTWQDYVPVFLANGFFKNRREFEREHIQWSRYSSFPKVDRYLNTGRLVRYRNEVLVKMDYIRPTVHHNKDVFCDYDIRGYKEVGKTRWDPYKNAPVENAAGLCYLWRKIVNSSEERQVKLLELTEAHPRSIIFYTFDYELDILRSLAYGHDMIKAEWNGHKHEPMPEGKRWVYFVQYTAGSEGWNCVSTDTIIFYSQNYSYKTMVQAAGRIDRLNTPFTDLYYFHLKSKSPIDLAISRALKEKKDFNANRFVKW